MHNNTDHTLVIEYDLPPCRRKIRKKKEAEYRNIFQLYREYIDICNSIRNLGYEVLDPPIQKGWKRMYVLREDIQMSKYSDFFQGILDKINTIVISNRKDFKVKKHRKGKYRYVLKQQELKKLDECTFLKEFDDKEKEYFTREAYFCRYSKRLKYKYIFTQTWRFVLKTFPNMIDKVKIIDPILESKSDLLSVYLHDKKQIYHLDIIQRGSWSECLGYNRHQSNPLKNKTKTAIMQEYDSEKKFEASL